MPSLQTCPISSTVAALGKRSAQEDREPRLTSQSPVCFSNIFACIKWSEYISNGKPDKNRLSAMIPHLEHGSRRTPTQMPFLYSSLHWAAGDHNKQNTRPQACYFCSGILHLFQQDWGDRLPLFSLGERTKVLPCGDMVTEDLLMKKKKIKQAKCTFNSLKSG